MRRSRTARVYVQYYSNRELKDDGIALAKRMENGTFDHLGNLIVFRVIVHGKRIIDKEGDHGKI